MSLGLEGVEWIHIQNFYLSRDEMGRSFDFGEIEHTVAPHAVILVPLFLSLSLFR